MASRSGFSLIEVVVAVVIIGAVATAAMATVAAQNDAAYRTRRMIEASALAEHRLAEVGVSRLDELRLMQRQAQRGEFTEPFDDYSWSASVQEDPVMADVYIASVTVMWTARDSLRLTTSYYRSSHAAP